MWVRNRRGVAWAWCRCAPVARASVGGRRHPCVPRRIGTSPSRRRSARRAPAGVRRRRFVSVPCGECGTNCCGTSGRVESHDMALGASSDDEALLARRHPLRECRPEGRIEERRRHLRARVLQRERASLCSASAAGPAAGRVGDVVAFRQESGDRRQEAVRRWSAGRHRKRQPRDRFMRFETRVAPARVWDSVGSRRRVPGPVEDRRDRTAGRQGPGCRRHWRDEDAAHGVGEALVDNWCGEVRRPVGTQVSTDVVTVTISFVGVASWSGRSVRGSFVEVVISVVVVVVVVKNPRKPGPLEMRHP